MSVDPLNGKVLVVNSGFMYVNIINTRKAIKLLCLGSVEVVTSDYQQFDFNGWVKYSQDNPNKEMIHSAHISILPPKVLRVYDYHDIPSAKIRFSRKNVYKRDNYTCQYCGDVYSKQTVRGNINIDHVIPSSKGGKTTWENVVTACFDCNSKKDNHLPSECNMYPRTTPSKPSAISLLDKILDRGHVDEEWKPFLSYLGV